MDPKWIYNEIIIQVRNSLKFLSKSLVMCCDSVRSFIDDSKLTVMYAVLEISFTTLTFLSRGRSNLKLGAKFKFQSSQYILGSECFIEWFILLIWVYWYSIYSNRNNQNVFIFHTLSIFCHRNESESIRMRALNVYTSV